MKKVFYVLSFLLLCIFLNNNIVKAECDDSSFKELKELATKVQIGYDFDQESKTFNLKAYNLNPKFYLYMEDMYYFYQSDEMELGNFIDNIKTKVVVYGSTSSKCYDEKLYSINVVLPAYNKYSEYKECIGNEDKDICKKWYNVGKMTEEEFLKQINKKEVKKEKKTFEIIKDFLLNNWIYLLIGFITISIVAVVFIIINKKNNKYS